jgi:peptidyl-prolyl cis-trans isomerase B (cyclophilin B)
MGFGGRSGIQEPIPDEVTGNTFLDRVNSFGERHARAIIILSTALIIVTVLIFAQVLWNRTLFDRVDRDLAAATSIEALESLRNRYKGTAAEPRVLATLGHRYASMAKLAEAKAVYREFLDKYADHVLASGVNRSLMHVEENLKFLESRKAALSTAPLLDAHPIRATKIPDHPLRMGPLKEKHPWAILKFKGKPDEIRIELFEDEAPNSVAAFVSLVEQKYFDGMAFTRINTDERLRLVPKKENPSTAEIAVEATVREPEAGSLALVRRGANNAAGEFDILLKPVGKPADGTVFGRVYIEGGSAAALMLQNLGEKDEIESLRIEIKRDHEYKPVFVKP